MRRKMIISDEIIKDGEKPDARKIRLDIPFDVLCYFLKRSDSVSSYSEFSSFHTTICFWTDDFLTSADFFKEGNATTIVFYPYDKMEYLAKKTKRDYIKEMDLCVKFIIDFAKKVDSMTLFSFVGSGSKSIKGVRKWQ